MALWTSKKEGLATCAAAALHDAIGAVLWKNADALSVSGWRMLASRDDDLARDVEASLAEGASANFEIELWVGLKVTGLAACLYMGAHGAARALLAAGADPSGVAKGALSEALPPLYFALRQPGAAWDASAEDLLARGADPMAKASRNYGFEESEGAQRARGGPEPVFMWMLFTGRDAMAERAMARMSDDGVKALVESLPAAVKWSAKNPGLFERVEGLRLESVQQAAKELSRCWVQGKDPKGAYDPQAQWAMAESDMMHGQLEPVADKKPAAKRRL